jgi:hypothetical protein
MRLKNIITESYDMREKFFDYLLDMARNGGLYKDTKDMEYVQSKLTNGEYRFHQHQVGNTPSRDSEWICSFDDLGITRIKKEYGGKEVIMFKRQ